MALEIGNIEATAGMAKAIYDQIKANIEPDLGDLSEEQLEPIRDGWRKLSHGIAKGVIEQLIANMEIKGIQTQGNVSTSIAGSTATASGHQHAAGSLAGTQNNVTFSQINEGTGFIE